MRFRDYFLVGLCLGLIYSAVRFPATLGCILILPFVVALVLIIVFWQWALIISGAVIIAVSLRQKHLSKEPAADTTPRDGRQDASTACPLPTYCRHESANRRLEAADQ
jgi:ABC-type sugar transport system permease subunit